MRKIRFLSIAVTMTIVIVLSRPADAQDKTKDEKEMDFRIQEEIDQHKKDMAEQKKILDEQLRIEDSRLRAFDEVMKEAAQAGAEAATKYGDVIRKFKFENDGPFPFGNAFVFTPGIDQFYFSGMSGDAERTTWDLSRTIRDNSFSREYAFDIEKSVKMVVMAVNGNCKGGEIRVRILMPNGKEYSDIVIDESGNLNWRKSFKISEEENRDKAGEWKFRIDATKATGNFKISLQTF